MTRALALGALFIVLIPSSGRADDPPAKIENLSIRIQQSERPDAAWQERLFSAQDQIQSVFGDHIETQTISAPALTRPSYFLFAIRSNPDQTAASSSRVKNLFRTLRAEWGRALSVSVDGYPVDMESPKARARAVRALETGHLGFSNFSNSSAAAMIPAAAKSGAFYDGGESSAGLPAVSARIPSARAAEPIRAEAAAQTWDSRLAAPPAVTDPIIAASAPPINTGKARRLARYISASARRFSGYCYRSVKRALHKAYIFTGEQLQNIRWLYAYQFADSINRNPELFSSRVRRIPGPALKSDALNGRLPVGAIIVYGRIGGVCRSGGAEDGVCGFSAGCGHIEIVTRDHARGPIQACSDGCRSIPESGGQGSLSCIAENALTGEVNAYVPVGRLESRPGR